MLAGVAVTGGWLVYARNLCPHVAEQSYRDMEKLMPERDQAPTIEEQARQLKAAGWIRVRGNIWKAPVGGCFLGPHGAWKAMKRREAVNA